MHLSLILVVFGVALIIRLCWTKTEASWTWRWQVTLGAFLLPPLLLLTTTVAVLCMGTQGTMLGLEVSWLGSLVALGVLSFAGGMLLYLGWQGWRSLQKVQTYPWVEVAGKSGRLLKSPNLFAAQIGFWRSHLVVSQGLLHIQPTQLQAVLAHEQAHFYYRDTFWFFWLGWLRRATAWLPKTEQLWQELLLLRELRADGWAAQRVDPLLLAETLLLMVKTPVVNSASYLAASATASSRLEERIEALISSPKASQSSTWVWVWLLLGLLPLLTVLLHT